ncbi:CIC11C00000000418 [Sungouiella intermedia]|uniref:Phosphatidate cytidylyltransferase n=1 Tax=Sungouiella intermedia TaxID=45354 RepID=A0A1L0BIC9_9ASCO|nr:CIC11C00000000418 [[Candida] intermedia]
MAAEKSPSTVVEKKTSEKPVETPKEKLPVVNEREKKKQTFITRTIWSLVMILGFVVTILLGHVPLIGIVLLFETLTFKEIIALTSEPARDKNIPWNKSLNWYLLVCTMYYLDGESFFLFLGETFVSYGLYILGFVLFVWTLKKGFYKFQFMSLCITHTTLILVVFQAHLIIENIFNGIIWFLLPVSLVIVNDIFAYLCGITFGKTQLIEISPKKTVEGFVGAWFCTGAAGVVFAHFLSMSDYLICPAVNLQTNVYNYPHCDPNPVFIPQIYQIPSNIAAWTGISVITMMPMYFHAAAIATFASLIAPFGGFFASGLKRAFGIKDFGDTIPGHGGITDRFDCQFLMGSFSYLYYQTFIASSNISLGKVLQMAVFHLSTDEIEQLVMSLLKYLNASGALDQAKLEQIFNLMN